MKKDQSAVAKAANIVGQIVGSLSPTPQAQAKKAKDAQAPETFPAPSGKPAKRVKLYPISGDALLKHCEPALKHIAEDDPRRKLHGVKRFLPMYEINKDENVSVDLTRRFPVLVTLPPISDDDSNGMQAFIAGYVAIHWVFNPITEMFTAPPDYITPAQYHAIVAMIPAPPKAVKAPLIAPAPQSKAKILSKLEKRA